MNNPTPEYVYFLLKNIDNNFSKLIDCLFYYGKHYMDEETLEIIYPIEDLEKTKLINLLVDDIESRVIEESYLVYDNLWFSLASDEDSGLQLIEKIKHSSSKEKIIQFLITLTGTHQPGNELEVQEILDHL